MADSIAVWRYCSYAYRSIGIHYDVAAEERINRTYTKLASISRLDTDFYNYFIFIYYHFPAYFYNYPALLSSQYIRS
jgi:hypothetical protein